MDEFPRFRKRGAALEGEVIANAGHREKRPQRPANPEILFDADGLQAQLRLNLLECKPTLVRRELEKRIHDTDPGSVMGRSRSAIQAGA